MKTIARMLLCITVMLAWQPASAAVNIYVFDTQEKQVAFDRLITTLRCPQCQNNNLADSNATLAVDMKNYIYRSVQQGRSEAEITDDLVARYGDFITYKPRIEWLWWLPSLIAIAAIAIVVMIVLRARRRLQSERGSDGLPLKGEQP